MGRVKGSKQHSMVIKHHQPHKQWMMGAAALLCAIMVWGVGFLFGQNFERQAQSWGSGGEQMLEQVRGEIAELEQGHLVDEVAIEVARNDLMAKQEKIHELEKSLAFYKGVLAPEKNAKGLQVDRFGIQKLTASRAFKLNWVLIQAGGNAKYLTGDTSVEVIGKLGGVKKVLSLKQVASEIPNLTFKFRYFQDFSIQVDLPEQFVAEKIVLKAATKGNKTQSISQQYEWAVQEVLAHVE